MHSEQQKNKSLKFPKFETGSDVSVQLPALFQQFVISYISGSGFSLPSLIEVIYARL
jgi:hypothetical protein